MLVEPLIESLESDDILYEIARALEQIGDERAIEPLIHVIDNEVDWVTNGPLAALDALQAISDVRAVEPLAILLEDEFTNKRIRRYAAEALGDIGEPAMEDLIGALGSGNIETIKITARVLWNIGEPAVEPLMREVYEDGEDEDVRKAAKEALKKLRGV